jgi:hypothetical protein
MSNLKDKLKDRTFDAVIWDPLASLFTEITNEIHRVVLTELTERGVEVSYLDPYEVCFSFFFFVFLLNFF